MAQDQNNKMQEEHLKLLTTYGQEYVSTMASAANMLEHEFYRELELTDAEKKEIYKVLLDTAAKHLEMIEWSIQERQKFFNSNHDKNG